MATVRTGDSIRLLDNLIWKKYKETKPPKKFSFENREELKKVVKEICKQIAIDLLEKKAGVLIRGLGYFFIWKIPKKSTYSICKKGESYQERFNYYTDNYMYSPTFVPTKSFEGWAIDKSFNNTFKRNLKNKLIAGQKYKMFLYSFQNILQNG